MSKAKGSKAKGSMMKKTVLITGANAGLGLETARQFGANGWGTVILACRNEERANKAKASLVAAGTKTTYEVQLVDVADLASVDALAKRLRGRQLDAVVLNAGGIPGPGPDGRPKKTETGVGYPFAVNVLGHAALVGRLLRHGVLADDGRVVFSSSEAARGIPAMKAAPHDLRELVKRHGTRAETIASVARLAHLASQKKMDDMTEYATVKLIGSLWIGALGRRVGPKQRVLAVSPGATRGTEAASEMPAAMKFMMAVMMPTVMRWAGMSHALEVGAARYVEAVEHPERFDQGAFYASPGTKVTGDLVRQEHAVLNDRALQEAAYDALVSLTEGAARVADAAIAAE